LDEVSQGGTGIFTGGESGPSGEYSLVINLEKEGENDEETVNPPIQDSKGDSNNRCRRRSYKRRIQKVKTGIKIFESCPERRGAVPDRRVKGAVDHGKRAHKSAIPGLPSQARQVYVRSHWGGRIGGKTFRKEE